ncbi:transporter substrate-binding domain-containing protein [Oscillibacter sp.]|uniref:transporter substrate-binding domain-containing protein n=1 Tax=Oscillibacter sp. TaxID=1945593 RepID=UPI0026262A5C|nr:transporter substrate-binding domain-containing protein [Oscillibacter sp.]MDD3346535.1 transporter substrate-binding domain-containing protein [Oscillibacter sp.]
MKKAFALLLSVAMVLSLAACGGKKEAAPEKTDAPASDETVDYAAMPIDELKKNITTVTGGKLTVATSPDFAPYEFYAIDDQGNAQLSGFDMALAQYIADYLGLELEVVPMDFDGVLSEVTAGNVDLGMAGLSPDPTRMDAMDFSDIYYQGGQSLVTTQANKDKWTELSQLNDPSLAIGAQLGSIQYDLAVSNTPDADIVQLAKVTDVVSELLGGKLDAGFIETVVAESYQKNYPDLYIAFDVPYEVEGSAVGVVKDNAPLLAGVNQAIAAVLADGSMDDFVTQANELAAGDIHEGLLEG